ncbi:MAG: aminotransferase class V-fold PLP-dependent enzyme [Candidatus Aquirickettsiella sp.]
MDTLWFKQQFNLDEDYIHLSLCLIASHPNCVQHRIDHYQYQLNRNPALFYRSKDSLNEKVLQAAADYLVSHPDNIALTNNTTEGLALVYMGFKLNPGDEILTSIHDHYASDKILFFKAKHSSAIVKKIELYKNPAEVTEQEIIENIKKNITIKTRLLALTWVHSCTGVKLPIIKIRKLIAIINRLRLKSERIILSIDAVHGLGVEDFNHVTDIGCDFLISGCHKWLYGPRGTGLVWGTEEAWMRLIPISASFDLPAFLPWRKKEYENIICPPARSCNPGGFPSFEYRWALAEAFHFNNSIGKKVINQKILTLATLCKQGLKEIQGIQLHTPLGNKFASGLVCFEVMGCDPAKIVDAMLEKKIMLGQTPYRNSCLRIAPSIINQKEDIDTALEVLKNVMETLTRTKHEKKHIMYNGYIK